MSDIFRRWSPGDALHQLPAELVNGLVEMYRDWLRRRGTKPGQIKIPDHAEVYVQNESGENRDQYSIVALGAPLVFPAEDDDFFLARRFSRRRRPWPGNRSPCSICP